MKSYEHGLFITFEGPDAAGKSTQMKLLGEKLRGLDYEVVETREPGGTVLGELVRSLLVDLKNEEITPEAELLLFAASRAQHMRKVIRPCLKRGGIVLCDRFADSTMAYQGYARGLDHSLINSANEIALSGRRPDLTFLLDLSPEEGANRMRRRTAAGGAPLDRIEREGSSFQSVVRRGYLEIAKQEPNRVKVIDADKPLELVAADIWWEVNDVLG